jgi:hypothetical protein
VDNNIRISKMSTFLVTQEFKETVPEITPRKLEVVRPLRERRESKRSKHTREYEHKRVYKRV